MKRCSKGSHRGRSLLVPGVNPVREALKTLPKEVLVKIFLSRREIPKGIDNIVSQLSIPVQRVTRGEMDALLPGVNHQGMALEIQDFPYGCEEDLFKGRRLVFLDEVQSPVNLGTISRASAFFGIDAVFMGKRRSSGVTPLAIKASEGGIFHVRLVRVKSPTGVLRDLKKEGFFLVGAVEKGGVDPMDIKEIPEKIVVLFGGEDTSLRPIRRSLCDLLVTVRGEGRIGSLNVSQACSIILYAISKLV